MSYEWVDELTPAPPQVYTENLHRYLARGGVLDPPADIKAFQHNDRTRFFAWATIFDQLAKEKIGGDFAELGVYKGYTATFLALMARRMERTVYLCDTFEGFDERDLENGRLAGAFADTSLESVRARVGEESVVYVRGRFPDSSREIPPEETFAFVHLDCDLGEPMRAGLEYFYPRMSPGGFIVMHDYGSLHWEGAERAVDEFFAQKPESVIPLPDMCGSGVVRKHKG